MKVVSGHCPQDGVDGAGYSGILEPLPGSGPPRREVITPGYGQLDYNSSRIYRGTNGLYEGISVRCIKDNNSSFKQTSQDRSQF